MILFSKFFNEIFIWESITVLLRSLYVIFPPCCSHMNKLANSFFFFLRKFDWVLFCFKSCVPFTPNLIIF